MDRVKGITKNGYHPTGKDGGKESWRGDFKGINKVAKLVGHEKNPNATSSAKDHSSRPLTSLRDPDSFGPPPKNLSYHSGAASPSSTVPSLPARGLGAPLSPAEIRAQNDNQRSSEEQAVRKPAPPPVPYRADRTGINTNSLPKPPVRRVGDGSSSADSASGPMPPTKPPKPNLPPRLPPRQNSRGPLQSAPVDPPPTYSAATQEQREWSQQSQPPPPPARHNVFANQEGALSRLGSAGVSVPGLGIGRSASPPPADNPWTDEPSPRTDNSASPSANKPSLAALSSRLGHLSTAASPPPAKTASPPPPSPGTSFAQKQAALKTASSFRNDPSSVSLSDAKATASTANNFRERHGDQVAQGWKVGNGLNKKYGIADRVGAATGSPATEHAPASPASPATLQTNPWAGAIGGGGINRKAPPPPVPLGSKPR